MWAVVVYSEERIFDGLYEFNVVFVLFQQYDPFFEGSNVVTFVIEIHKVSLMLSGKLPVISFFKFISKLSHQINQINKLDQITSRNGMGTCVVSPSLERTIKVPLVSMDRNLFQMKSLNPDRKGMGFSPVHDPNSRAVRCWCSCRCWERIYMRDQPVVMDFCVYDKKSRVGVAHWPERLIFHVDDVDCGCLFLDSLCDAFSTFPYFVTINNLFGDFLCPGLWFF